MRTYTVKSSPVFWTFSAAGHFTFHGISTRGGGEGLACQTKSIFKAPHSTIHSHSKLEHSPQKWKGSPESSGQMCLRSTCVHMWSLLQALKQPHHWTANLGILTTKCSYACSLYIHTLNCHTYPLLVLITSNPMESTRQVLPPAQCIADHMLFT